MVHLLYTVLPDVSIMHALEVVNMWSLVLEIGMHLHGISVRPPFSHLSIQELALDE